MEGSIILAALSIFFILLSIISAILLKFKNMLKETTTEGEGEMDILKKDVNVAMNELNQAWVAAIREGQEKGEWPDMSAMFSKYSKIISDIDDKFNDAKDRQYPAKKGLFSR